MDDKGYKVSEGSCIISEDVIATIANTAAMEVPGVAGMAQRPADIRGIMATGATKQAQSSRSLRSALVFRSAKSWATASSAIASNAG